MMNKTYLSVAVALVAVAVASFSFVGCETTDGTGGLTVTPSTVTLADVGLSQLFTVGGTTTGTNGVSASGDGGLRNLSIPLKWTVSDANLGYIQSSSGDDAVYVRTRRNGVNVITVQDQYGAEGLATVTQTTPTTTSTSGSGSNSQNLALTLTASPNPIPVGVSTSLVTVVSTGTAPYTWNVGTGTKLSGGTSGSIVYQSSVSGANAVTVTDSANRQGSITITQQ